MPYPGSRQVKVEPFAKAKAAAVTSDRTIAREKPELAKASADLDAVTQWELLTEKSDRIVFRVFSRSTIEQFTGQKPNFQQKSERGQYVPNFIRSNLLFHDTFVGWLW
tara:strand:+ start:17055 stop:17378 length:324 start_codon:yes stop_codon:yes gene_type:complete